MNGVVYIAFGGHKLADHIKEVNYSVGSLKKMHPNLSVTLFTDEQSKPRASALFDEIRVVPIGGEREKQNLLWQSPYERTLYLDSDTRIVNPILSMFDLLDRFDIAAALDHARKDMKKAAVYPEYDLIPDSFSEFAGGVILFRKSPEVEEFFKAWQRNYATWCELSGRINDQPSFRVTMWQQTALKVFTLPPEYNIRTQEKRDAMDNLNPRIYHWHMMYDPKINNSRKPQRF